MQKDVKKLLERHENLTHSQMKKVTSHVQRVEDEWFINTLMIEDCSVPFRYKRRKKYKNLKGARVDLTYYPAVMDIGGIEMEFMKIVTIKRS